MRLALFGLAATLSTLPSFARDAQDLRVSQSTVSIVAAFSRPGETADPVARPDGDVNVRTPLDRVRYGNAQLLRTFFAVFDTQEPKITDIKGWSIIAVWANWPSVGNSYKFFARKGAERREIPETLLKLDLVDAFVGKNVTRKDGAILSGTEKHKIYATLTLGAITVTDGDADDEDPRATASGAATGMVFGTGNYTRPSGSATAIYRPITDTFTGYGQVDNPGDQEDDVLSVTLRVGPSTTVAASLHTSGTPTEPSNGPGTDISPSSFSGSSSGSVLVSGSGSLRLNGNNTYAGTTTVVGGTLTIGNASPSQAGSMNLTVSTPTSTPTFDGVLISGGTVSFAPGSIFGTNATFTLTPGSGLPTTLDLDSVQ